MTLAEWADVATIAGVIGVAIGAWQLIAARSIQREATAVEIWNGYLRLALEFQSYAKPPDHLTTHGSVYGDGEEVADFDGYEWYVSSMLFACERVLTLNKRDEDWLRTIRKQLALHWVYFQSKEFDPALYSKEIQTMLRVAVDEHPPHPELVRLNRIRG